MSRAKRKPVGSVGANRIVRALPTVHLDDWCCSVCGAAAGWGEGWRWVGKADGPIEKILCPDCPDPDGVLAYEVI